MKHRNWFEVSREGLRELQEGKPKDFIVRELIQNAWDENITRCSLETSQLNGMAEIRVEDDSPEGFKDLTHAFTLFAPTYKRAFPHKRGRFNIGEKQVLAICKEASVSTTKGTIVFNSEGRTHKRLKQKEGSIISLKLRMNQEEYNEMLDAIGLYLPPAGVEFKVNDVVIPHKEPYRLIVESLPTEIRRHDRMISMTRQTEIHIHKKDQESSASYLYEMGLPICEIDCEYSIDIQQKVPLSTDRDKVSPAYLQKVFALILNEMYYEVPSEICSESWIREAMSNKAISGEAIRSIVKTKYGDKVAVATPGDRHGIDEALSEGYRVIYGNELSSKEWKNIRKAKAMESTISLFPSEFAEDCEKVENLTDGMVRVKKLVNLISNLCFGINVNVKFGYWTGCAAQYGDKTLIFNVKVLGKRFFEEPVSAKVIDLIAHELAHEVGFHTETSYHKALSQMVGELTMLAFENPEALTSIKEAR